MPHRRQDFEQHHFYHIYNRGNNKEKIFFERENYRFFLRKFIEYMPPNEVEIHAYCLMPNHYHFIVRVIEEFNYSRAMQHFGISYAKSINSRYGRTGHLFQGRFGARLVHTTEYLLHLSWYLHLNPVDAHLVTSAKDWEFSSYRDYVSATDSSQAGDRQVLSAPGNKRRPHVTTEVILSLLGGVQGYRDFVELYGSGESRHFDEDL